MSRLANGKSRPAIRSSSYCRSIPTDTRLLTAFELNTPTDRIIYFVDANSCGELRWQYSDVETDSQRSAAGPGCSAIRKRSARAHRRDVRRRGIRCGRPPSPRSIPRGTSPRRKGSSMASRHWGLRILRAARTTSGPTAPVDAHVYAGFTYDYYFKRFGRHGLDNNRHPRPRADPPGPAARRSSRPRQRFLRPFLRERVLRGRRRHGLRRRFAVRPFPEWPVRLSTTLPARSTSWRTS